MNHMDGTFFLKNMWLRPFVLCLCRRRGLFWQDLALLQVCLRHLWKTSRRSVRLAWSIALRLRVKGFPVHVGDTRLFCMPSVGGDDEGTFNFTWRRSLIDSLRECTSLSSHSTSWLTASMETLLRSRHSSFGSPMLRAVRLQHSFVVHHVRHGARRVLPTQLTKHMDPDLSDLLRSCGAFRHSAYVNLHRWPLATIFYAFRWRCCFVWRLWAPWEWWNTRKCRMMSTCHLFGVWTWWIGSIRCRACSPSASVRVF